MAVCLCATGLVAQGIRYDSVVQSSSAIAGVSVSTPVAGATVTFCNVASISSATEVSTTVTVTTLNAHGFSVGQSVKIFGVGVTGYNGTYTVATTPTTTSFTYVDSSSGLGNSSGGGAAPNNKPCTPTATIYTDQSLTVTATNPVTTDTLGNFGAWLAPGTYVYSITGTGLTSSLTNLVLPVGSSPNGAINACANGNTRYIYGDSDLCWNGADVGAKIASADSNLGSGVGQIQIVGSGTISTAVTLSASHDLVCIGDQTVLTYSNTTAKITQGSNTKIKGCLISSAQTTGVAGEIFSQGTANVEIDNVTFSGGGTHVQYNNVNGCRVKNTRHVSVTAPASLIFIFQSSSCQIISPRIEGFTYPVSASAFRAIYIQGSGGTNSSNVEVLDPVILNIDATTINTFAGVSFSQADHSSLTGGIITGLKNGDGVVTEAGSTDIDITGTQSYGNSPSGGAGANANTGDGFDIFNSARVHIANCGGGKNGIASSNHHHNVEVFTSTDVTVQGCDVSNGGFAGIAVIGSPRTKLIAVKANRNQQAGASFSDASGTVNTSGTSVTLVSGINFGLAWDPNTKITINSVVYKIASVQGGSALTLSTSAGTQSGVTYAVSSYDGEVIGGEYSGNGLAAGATGTREGLYFSGGASARVQGVIGHDATASQTQTYGARLENTARAVFIGNDFSGNLSGEIQDSVAKSPILRDDGSTAGSNIVGNIQTGAGAFVLIGAGVPAISSGFGTSPSIPFANSTASFRVNVGTGGTATNGVIGMPLAAANGWNCLVNNLTAAAGHRADNTVQTANTASTVTIENQTKSTGAAVAWTASDIVTLDCKAF